MTQVTGLTESATDIAWSPDGRRIAPLSTLRSLPGRCRRRLRPPHIPAEQLEEEQYKER